MKTLRPYQDAALHEIRGHLARKRKRIMLCAPTGAGKTVIGTAIMEAARQKGKRALFVADREVLVLQTSQRLDEDLIPHGIIMSDKTRDQQSQILIASEQTLEARGWVPDVDIIIKDEAHGQRKFLTEFLMNHDIPAVGLSATPFTKGLGLIWQELVNARTTNDLICDGVLSRLEIYQAHEVDMTGAPVNSFGEWSDKTVEERAITICGEVVGDYVRLTDLEFGGPVPTLVFSATVAHGEELCRQFASVGLHFEQVSYKDKSTDERQHKLRMLEDGKITGLIAVDCLSKGYDNPAIKCMVMTRAYKKSLAAVIQSLGRGMRGSPGKEFALLLDHSGNWNRFANQVEQFFDVGCTELDDGKKKEAEERKLPEPKTINCRHCGFFMPAKAETCPKCGTVRPVVKSKVVSKPGKMLKYKSLSQEVGDLWPHLSVMAINRKPMATDEERAKWARVQHKTLTGRWPKWGRPLEPCEVPDLRVVKAVNEEFEKWRRQQHAIRRSMAKR